MPSTKSPASPYKLRSLPVIDIAPWVAPESAHVRGHNGGRRSTSAALHAACLTYGFFYLDVSSYADQEEMEELSELARRFFALPQEEKDKLALANQDGARGYQRLKENVTNGKADNHEGLDFYAPVEQTDKSKPLHGENQWPSDEVMPGFRERFEKWIEKMKKLGMIVMEAMSVGLGMTPEEWEQLKSKVDNSFWVMRAIGYPPLPNDYDGYSCGAHNFLYADPTPNALQVFLPQDGILDDAATTPAVLDEQNGEKGVWINVDPMPGCVVCNIGESMSESPCLSVWMGWVWEVWTNGLYKSTLHRVVHQGSNYRIPFFFEPNFTARVEPLAAALRLQKDSIQPAYAHYEPVVYGEFLLKKVAGNFASGKGKYD
ncbi:Clavaminate synthase-like protein [Fomitiporia mediterranea MF3/22]|uniref:Clavaminate synthase-like protein n=1 Tax=Fomitiporia mediterranea (strain MF3/22) TaxID=694068 RepID=UPI00044079A5|nr:Clavaminate synthase-like protein [Fomitiporia mediterranea MF3/22]EJC98113.1 Clavaminate synthase-like protein [Fomitiporia mediterranea MF3/22]